MTIPSKSADEVKEHLEVPGDFDDWPEHAKREYTEMAFQSLRKTELRILIEEEFGKGSEGIDPNKPLSKEALSTIARLALENSPPELE